MTISDNKNKTLEVVINVGKWSFSLTDDMMKELNIYNRFPSEEELPRHDKDLVTLVREGHGTILWNGKEMGLVVKTIHDKDYRICKHDGEETLETLCGNKWFTVE